MDALGMQQNTLITQNVSSPALRAINSLALALENAKTTGSGAEEGNFIARVSKKKIL